MISIDVSVEPKGAINKVRAFFGFINKGEFLERAGDTITALVKEGFDKSESPYGHKWDPIKCDKDRSPLVNTGDLKRSIKHSISGQTINIGTTTAFAGVHQYGYTMFAKPGKRMVFTCGEKLIFAKKVKIPPRPFLPAAGIPKKWTDIIENVISDKFKTEIK